MKILHRRLVRVAAAAVAVIGWGGVLVAPTGTSAATVTIDSTVHGVVIDSSPHDGSFAQNVVKIAKKAIRKHTTGSLIMGRVPRC